MLNDSQRLFARKYKLYLIIKKNKRAKNNINKKWDYNGIDIFS